MKTVIMAGGKGSRIASVAPGIPKAMIRLHGKPILQYQLECLARNSLADVIITIGHLGYVIKDFFGDGEKSGCNISYFEEQEPLGTGGALFKIIDTLGSDFIVINGDVVFDIDFSRLIDIHKCSRAWATLVVHPNDHPYDSAVLVTDAERRVINWLNKEDPREYYRNQVNAGVHILSTQLLRSATPLSEKVDLDREVLKPLIQTENIFAYPTPEYIRDMGTPERCAQVSADIKAGVVQKKNLKVKQKAVFLDRDGTINVFNSFVKRPEDFELIDGAARAIKNINSLGFLAIVITNQPVIARGEVDFETLNLIHMKMETMLGNHGAYINDLFFCPHHPDGGFAGEKPEYKIDCDCRKPKPGMILAAAKKYNVDLSYSYMIGDDECDVKAGIAAGCVPVFLTKEPEKMEIEKHGSAVLQFSSLIDFVEAYL
ncbi:MAG: HAD-IIIA family hydrolase [Treponema sp.]|nr:HAD-IIIA family hydrolase [Treponema sp.]